MFMLGHANYTLEKFMEILKIKDISVLYDIRLMPFSSYVTNRLYLATT